MKKFTFTALLFIICNSTVLGQSLISMNPNQGTRGAQVNSIVTGSNFFFNQSSMPTNMGDFFLRKNNYTIVPFSVGVIDNDTLNTFWQIPLYVPDGTYDLVWDTCYFAGGGCEIILSNAFGVADVSISGKVWFDGDSSLTQNGQELGLFSKAVMLLPDSVVSYTDLSGNYLLTCSGGNKTVKVFPGNNWKTTTDSTIDLTVLSGGYPGNNFGLKGALDFYGIDVTVTSGASLRCFWTRPIILTYTNTGTITTHGEVKFIKPASCNYSSASVGYNSMAGNTYTWNYTNLQPGESRNIIVWLTLPGGVTQITLSMQGNAQNPQNQIVTQDESFANGTVHCAYDPNDKTVIPEGILPQHFTLMSDTLDFLIRFQNTGNDTAFKVVILDTLDKNILDLSTFQVITYSHPVVTELKTNGALKFTFDNILLPDSNINEPGSHGWIRYRCMPKTGLPNNTVLNNTAYIYFDLNSPVITNTTLNTLVYQLPLGIAESTAAGIMVMPNPVTSDAVFTLPDDGRKYEIKIFDSTGKLLYNQPVNNTRTVVPSRSLGKGIHLYQVRSTDGTNEYTGKFVVM